MDIYIYIYIYINKYKYKLACWWKARTKTAQHYIVGNRTTQTPISPQMYSAKSARLMHPNLFVATHPVNYKMNVLEM